MKGIVNTYLNERIQQPSLDAENKVYYEPGDEVEIVKMTKGMTYENNPVWFELSNGSFIWSGGVDVNFWWIKDYGVEGLWEKGYTGSGIKVAVLDSGISLPHIDLEVQKTHDASQSGHVNDLTGHGTHVTGIIKATKNHFGVTGIAYDADVSFYKITNDKYGDGKLKYMIDGLNECIKEGVDIISLSIGKEKHYKSLKKIIKKAKRKSILIVCAAGNRSEKVTNVLFPAAYKETLSVGGINENKQPLNSTISQSNTDLFAPGHNIFSTYLNNDFASLEGSSQATPFVSGIAALLLQAARRRNKKYNPLELKEVLIRTATFSGGIRIINPLNALNQY